ncbi:hypothetical protein BMAPRL20_A3466 [Burkholderia mallei PRL-20]|uniref:Uncharacterized protein n=1 Tax=Burkholderia pseudomallei 1710a TaxID=320371 RepID=A0A0E1WGJ1_BURPE|nr:hypothetical protein BURPS668_0209 [Burkholderia pseudomallei 668]ACQ96750.1 conserved hypothetical protein [Burkholderia pseudomallei MSHR346]EEC32106.1 conserved hypothetical protein [Burkholderia pseudomallei 576]EEH24225.1 conserved hypothetical protein [Burkholderia pseudomallei Pakistan 9]EEP83428.1 conserved hypothetical protein [Burkholderia mallei GB8 horse 4]EES43314.1 hypothetical protein BMAPRL20_A3466 [Burkholderia mallei PRL-20]EET08737.1 hypothetical protein BURPS1710A_0475 
MRGKPQRYAGCPFGVVSSDDALAFGRISECRMNHRMAAARVGV